MAFPRRDIPKMTRAGQPGEPRRLFLRYLRDRRLWPSIERAIDYLDSMVGSRRGDLNAGAVLDLFGDPKLARCLLASLGESYRFRALSFRDMLGDAANLLATQGIVTPADLRDRAYLALQDRHGGVLEPEERERFLTELAASLGLSGATLEEMLFLDSERNQRLVRIGPKPDVTGVVARYNAMLTLSVLRQASVIEITLPGLSRSSVETIAARWEVVARRRTGDVWRLSGRQDGRGSWARFGGKLARCAVHLILLCEQDPDGWAQVHLDERRTRFVLDSKVIATLRLKHRLVAGPAAALQAARMVMSLGEGRRERGLAGWVARRTLEPIVHHQIIVLPEFTMTRGDIAVALVPVSSQGDLEAVRTLRGWRPVIALGELASSDDVPVVSGHDSSGLGAALEQVVHEASRPTPANLVTEELRVAGWVPWDRLTTLLGPIGSDGGVVAGRLGVSNVAVVPGTGVFRADWLETWQRRFEDGKLDIAGLRSALAHALGDMARADALTLHLLTQTPVTARQAA